MAGRRPDRGPAPTPGAPQGAAHHWAHGRLSDPQGRTTVQPRVVAEGHAPTARRGVEAAGRGGCNGGQSHEEHVLHTQHERDIKPKKQSRGKWANREPAARGPPTPEWMSACSNAWGGR
eukprot:5966336-Prymnesium_polylepis.1